MHPRSGTAARGRGLCWVQPVVLQLAFAGAALLAAPARAHEFHVSLAEVEYIPDTSTLEVALRVAPEHLEAALGTRAGRRVRLVDTAACDSLVATYLRDTFVVTASDGDSCTLAWVGKEVSPRAAWLYFEMPLPGGLAGSVWSNHVLFELDPEQVNTINLKTPAGRTSLVFDAQTPRWRLTSGNGAAVPLPPDLPADSTSRNVPEDP